MTIRCVWILVGGDDLGATQEIVATAQDAHLVAIVRHEVLDHFFGHEQHVLARHEKWQCMLHGPLTRPPSRAPRPALLVCLRTPVGPTYRSHVHAQPALV